MMELSDIRSRVNAAILLGDMEDYVRDVTYLLLLIEEFKREIERLQQRPKARYH